MFGSIAEADAYLSASTQWAELSDPEKTRHLVSATRFINSLTWKGNITDVNQLDSWPRVGVIDQEGRKVSSETVPQAILDAVFELADDLAAGLDIYPSYEEQGVKSERVKAGPVETHTIWNSASKPRIVSPTVEALVSGLLESSSTGSTGEICRA